MQESQHTNQKTPRETKNMHCERQFSIKNGAKKRCIPLKTAISPQTFISLTKVHHAHHNHLIQQPKNPHNKLRLHIPTTNATDIHNFMTRKELQPLPHNATQSSLTTKCSHYSTTTATATLSSNSPHRLE